MRATILRAVPAGLLIVAMVGLNRNHPSADLRAQPTYKLDVKPYLKPLSTLNLEGTRVRRTELADDPGFRLQFRIQQADGKTVTTAEARANPGIDLPMQAAGTFTVVLELFYPAYKGGTSQKGEFRPVSNVLGYKIAAGKITPMETLPPPIEPMLKDKK